MTTRHERLRQFSQAAPPISVACELLCEDTRGTYALPFSCRYEGGRWLQATTDAAIDSAVVGWRAR